MRARRSLADTTPVNASGSPIITAYVLQHAILFPIKIV